ncbi:MAG TPA: NAD(P)/FAD-dependent oxidoreductase [Polyangiaceae bacterium]|nr:NAD(P)/FAD-dependent oxidoreductase [Polyangiaceae bacterium]
MTPEHFDVLIVGAGLSGVGSASHLQQNCPDHSFAILEGRESIGGTWDLFRYPGIRSDSDMYTLGYSFRPWTDSQSIADGPAILRYIRDAAQEGDIERHIRFSHRVKRATWSSETARWTVEAERGSAGERVVFTCNFLHMCVGYYRYEAGYTPKFRGIEQFQGRVVHPQHWTEDIDYADKRVIVIGSGATAVTLVPELAKEAAHVVMLQRSPTYMIALPEKDPIALWLQRRLPPMLAYGITRWKNVTLGMLTFSLSVRSPGLVRRALLKHVRQQLGENYDVQTHFSPRYKPWDQRLCVVKDGDLFDAIKDGRASVVTDHIETFTETGIELRSGKFLEADLVVTATGLELLVLDGIEVSVDGKLVHPEETLSYKGMMYSGVPNLASSLGYTNASWTLKCDLTCGYVCRLLNHMKEHNYQICTPRLTDPTVKPIPALDFTSGYVQRAIHKLPKQGSKKPWKLYQNYALDVMSLGYGKLEDGTMEFRTASRA